MTDQQITRPRLHRLAPLLHLAAALAVGAAALAYLLVKVVGTNTFAGHYVVRVQMPVTGGLFPGSQITYRGVPIGTVGTIRISDAGVVADLDIRDGVHVPAATRAVVTDRSPAGEQYIDLQPTAAGPPYLHDGSLIPANRTQRPPTLADLLTTVTSFSDSISAKDLRIVIDQLATAFGGTGPALGRLIDNSERIVATLRHVQPATIGLLDSGGQLVDTEVAHAGDLATYSRALRQLADTLRADDPKTVALINSAMATTAQLGPFLARNADDLGTFLANLVTTGQIVRARIPAVKALLVALPDGIQALDSAVHGNHVTFTLVAKSGAVCSYSTRRRTPFQAAPAPPIMNGYCLNPSGNEQQRGAVYAPRPPGDTTAGPPGGRGGSSRSRAAADTPSWATVFGTGAS